MRFLVLTKRFYMQKDLLGDRFGRNYHLPIELGRRGHDGLVLAFDYGRHASARFAEDGVEFVGASLGGKTPGLGLGGGYVAVRDFEPDIIIGSTDVHFGAAAVAIGRRLGVPSVYDLYDNYEAFASARIPGMAAIHRRTLRSADLVLAVSPALADHVRPDAERVVVIGNGVDRSVFFRRPKDEARRRFGLPDDGPVIGYVGGITDGRGLDLVLSAIRLIRERGRDARLVLAGHNASQLDLSEPWVVVIPPMPQADVPAIISTFDVAVWPYVGNSWGRFVHPTKLGEYLACGVPVVATDLPEFRRVAPFEGLLWFDSGREESLADAVLEGLTRDGPVGFPEALTWTAQANALERALRAVVAS